MSMTHRGAFAVVSQKTAAWIAGLFIVIAASDLTAQERPAPFPDEPAAVSSSLARVERLFWLCDYVATTRGVDSAPVHVCVAATEDLKNAKFGGDFMALLDWWRGNKPEEHARLAHVVAQPVPSRQQEDRAPASATAF